MPDKPGENKKILSWFRYIMAVAYVLFGLTVLVINYFIDKGQGNKYHAALGWLLLVYGLFRSYRVYRDFNGSSELNNET